MTWRGLWGYSQKMRKLSRARYRLFSFSGTSVEIYQFGADSVFCSYRAYLGRSVGGPIGLAHSYISIRLDARMGGIFVLWPSYSKISYYVGYYTMQFLYDEHND